MGSFDDVENCIYRAVNSADIEARDHKQVKHSFALPLMSQLVKNTKNIKHQHP
jgi:hypothetical protein